MFLNVLLLKTKKRMGKARKRLISNDRGKKRNANVCCVFYIIYLRSNLLRKKKKGTMQFKEPFFLIFHF